MDAYEERLNAWAPLATPADAHREWHRNAGVPMGTPGCPQDACHIDDLDYDPDEPLVRCGCGCEDYVPIWLVKAHFEAKWARR